MATKKTARVIIPEDVFIAEHEKQTANFLATNLQHDVTFLKPDRRKEREHLTLK